jgi:pyruvate formate lyase activating enzyme
MSDAGPGLPACRRNSIGQPGPNTARNAAKKPGTAIDELALEAPSRRRILQLAALPCLASCAQPLNAAAPGDSRFIREAKFYEKQPYRKIKCKLCPRECVIDDQERGYCGVRENRGGTYYTLVHSRVCAQNIDPVEKKPLFHFAPGTLAFSVATAGCNVNCKMCQNWEISQSRPEQVRAEYIPPAALAGLARGNRCYSIAYTYSEPVVYCEYVLDAAEAARTAGVRSVVVSGGYVQPEPLAEMCRRVDAIKIDVKGFTEKFYREVVNGELKPVLKTLAAIRAANVWTEIVYLVIPTLNDSDQEFKALSKWIKTELGPDVPVHFTRFHPEYLLKNLPGTPVGTLERAKAIADAEGLNYAYVGNVPGHPAENTRCPKCRRVVVERTGFTVRDFNIVRNKCKFCQTPIAGRWDGAVTA